MTGRTIVFGGNGFLGSWVCAALSAAGYRVLSVSRSGGRSPMWGGEIETLATDLSTVDVDGLRLLTRGADVVVNAAASAWVRTEEPMLALHVRFVQRLVEAVATAGGRPRLVQLGSSYEYGAAEFGTATTENDPAPPISAYGRTKRQGTEAVLRAAGEGRVEAVVLRVANMSGPGAYGGSLPGMVARSLADGAAELRLAALRSWRDYVDVRDVAAAVLAAVTAPAEDVNGRAVNIGGGRAVHVRDLVHRLITLSGVPARVVEQTGDGREPMPWQQLDLGRAHRLLGWRPTRGLDDSLADLLEAARQSELGGTSR